VLIVDTGPLVAAADRADRHHAASVDLLESASGPLVTTAMVIAETAYLLARELGPRAEPALYDAINDGSLGGERLNRQIGAASVTSLTSMPTCHSEEPMRVSSRLPSGWGQLRSPRSTGRTSLWSGPATATRSRSCRRRVLGPARLQLIDPCPRIEYSLVDVTFVTSFSGRCVR
jgi:hypothetical protein